MEPQWGGTLTGVGRAIFYHTPIDNRLQQVVKLSKHIGCVLHVRGYGPMSLTFDCVSVAEGREPSGFAEFTGHSPNGFRRSANKVSAIWLSLAGYWLLSFMPV